MGPQVPALFAPEALAPGHREVLLGDRADDLQGVRRAAGADDVQRRVRWVAVRRAAGAALRRGAGLARECGPVLRRRQTDNENETDNYINQNNSLL